MRLETLINLKPTAKLGMPSQSVLTALDGQQVTDIPPNSTGPTSETVARMAGLEDLKGNPLKVPLVVIEFNAPDDTTLRIKRGLDGVLNPTLTRGGLREFLIPNVTFQELKNPVVSLHDTTGKVFTIYEEDGKLQVRRPQ